MHFKIKFLFNYYLIRKIMTEKKKKRDVANSILKF